MATYNRHIGNILGVAKKEGKIGLEIDCEGQSLFNAPLQWWTMHNEPSIKSINGQHPCEYVLTVPISRDDLDPALTYLTTKLARHSKVSLSHRTSVHVHLNQTATTMLHVVNIVCTYLLLEDLLVAWAGPTRVGNQFCLRARDAEYFITLLKECVASDNWDSLLFSSDYRYSSCNMASLSKFGSLEFRAMRGTVSKEEILSWVDMLLAVESFGLSHKNPQELCQWAEDLLERGRSTQLLTKILGSSLGLSVLENWEQQGTYGSVLSSLWDALRRVKDIAFAVQEWDTSAPPEVKKKPFKKPSSLYADIPGPSEMGTWYTDNVLLQQLMPATPQQENNDDDN